MLDFLKERNIEDEVLVEMINNNTDATIFDLSCNEDNCIKIISYLKEIGINNIGDLLINKIDIFLMTFEEFIKKMSKFNIPVIVDLINNDYSAADVIME